jgi:hypothetical protein
MTDYSTRTSVEACAGPIGRPNKCVARADSERLQTTKMKHEWAMLTPLCWSRDVHRALSLKL